MGIEELNRQFITPWGRWMAELWPSKDLSYDAFDLKGYGRILVQLYSASVLYRACIHQ